MIWNKNPWFSPFLPYTGCGDPGQVQNAQRTIVTSFSINGVVTYTCNSGYQIIGQGGQATTSAQITCTSSRRWTPLPVCTPESTQGETIKIHLLFNTLKNAGWSNKQQVGTSRCVFTTVCKENLWSCVFVCGRAVWLRYVQAYVFNCAIEVFINRPDIFAFLPTLFSHILAVSFFNDTI